MYLFVYIKNWSSDVGSFEIANVRLILILCTEQLGQMSLWSLCQYCLKPFVTRHALYISTNEAIAVSRYAKQPFASNNILSCRERHEKMHHFLSMLQIHLQFTCATEHVSWSRTWIQCTSSLAWRCCSYNKCKQVRIFLASWNRLIYYIAYTKDVMTPYMQMQAVKKTNYAHVMESTCYFTDTPFSPHRATFFPTSVEYCRQLSTSCHCTFSVKNLVTIYLNHLLKKPCLNYMFGLMDLDEM
jgi:hypothetical protein